MMVKHTGITLHMMHYRFRELVAQEEFVIEFKKNSMQSFPVP
jgi:hypothetical protein